MKSKRSQYRIADWLPGAGNRNAEISRMTGMVINDNRARREYRVAGITIYLARVPPAVEGLAATGSERTTVPELPGRVSISP